MRDAHPTRYRFGCIAGGSIRIWTILIVAGCAAVLLLAFWPESKSATPVAVDPHKHEHAGAELYTCGMHPQVLSEEPGECPICQMELTPVKVQTQPPQKHSAGAKRKVKYWRAPMDPDFISDHPGKSPMGMDLVPVYEDERGGQGSAEIRISPVVVQHMGVRTASVERKPVARTVRTVGSIDYDERNVREVTTKFNGWIEQLYADYTGQQVEKGMPLFRVYSPELYSSQEEYLLAIRAGDTVTSDILPQAGRYMRELVESARLRLKLFDISDEQIDALEQRGKPTKTLELMSPYTGIITEKTARDGMQVRPGMKLYTIADLSRVWVYVDIYENEVSFVKIGQDATVELSYLPGKVFHGKVIYVYPFVDTGTRTVKVRLEFDNPHLELKPGMFADVQLRADLGREGLQIPRSAVIDTGARQVAFVALGEGRFEPRYLQIGVDLGDDLVEVLQGLSESELVVTSGQFLLDSESKLREAVLKMIDQKGGGADEQNSQRGAEMSSDAEMAMAVPSEEGVPPVLVDAPRMGSASDLATAAEPIFAGYLALQNVLAQDGRDSLAAVVDQLEAPMAVFLAVADEENAGHASARAHVEAALRTTARMRGRSLDSVRAQFSELSKELTGLLALVGPDNIDMELSAFYCPMAGSSWLQTGDQARNPYYGFSMNQCGDPVSLPTEPAVAPQQ